MSKLDALLYVEKKATRILNSEARLKLFKMGIVDTNLQIKELRKFAALFTAFAEKLQALYLEMEAVNG